MPKRHREPAEEEQAREAGECASHASCRNGKRLEGYASQRFLRERASSTGPTPIKDDMGDELSDNDLNRADGLTIFVERSIESWRYQSGVDIRLATETLRWWIHRTTRD